MSDKKVPVTVFVDPSVETQFVIKPFAAGLAKAAPSDLGPEGFTATASGTYVNGQTDVDADVDYNG